MAKKRKGQTKPRTNNELPENPDYSDPRQLEIMIHKAFARTVDGLHKLEKEHPDILIRSDMDVQRIKRREKAARKYAPRVRDLVKDFCPDIPGVFRIEEEWAHINSMPITTYDSQESNLYLILGAAIWMLDHIKKAGKIRAATELLPKDEELMEDVYYPTIYDPVHRDEVISSMVYAIEQRNIDCEIPGKKRAKKKAKRPDPIDRSFVDTVTATQAQHQDVPSRRRFESLLALIPQADIDNAVANYENSLFSWIVCYYRCRAAYIPREKDLHERQMRLQANAENRMKGFLENFDSKTRNPIMGKDALNNAFPTPPAFPQNRLEQMMSDPFQLLEYIDEEEFKLEEESYGLAEETTQFTFLCHRLSTASYELLERDYGKEIADHISGFTPVDPYEMCFSLLYLLDTDSDLPWLYYPGTILSEYTGAMLPWANAEYDELEDEHWAEYYDSNNPYARTPVKNPPELADWYRLDYANRTSNADYQIKTNLAQIVYEMTGGIMPRDLHRYDDAFKHMRHYGVTGKKVQIPLLYCMMLLGESMHQSRDWRLEYNFPDELFADLMESIRDAAAEESEGSVPQDDSSEKQIKTLQKENEQLRRIAYEADREARDLQKQYDDLLQKGQREHQELSELREILFNLDNDLEAELEEDAEGIELPYTVRQTTVVFGGHDSWARAIKPMLSGDIRFIDRDMKPDADLIRHADVVWLQPNSISHAFYYKIINTIRTYKIPLHYFSFASAEKCAKQLASMDAAQQ